MSGPLPLTDANAITNATTELKLDAITSVPSTGAHATEPWSVQSVLNTLPDPPPTASTNSTTPIPFLHLLERLKTTKREGWRRFGILHGESISDHMYRMSIITMLAPPSLSSTLNIPHCTKMALVHDMAEALVGDITPVDGVTKEEKSRREAEAMEYLSSTLLGNWSGGKQGRGIWDVWEEYEEGKTRESVFVHDVDKIELLLQMVEYERRGQQEGDGKLDLGEFVHVATKVQGSEMKDWARKILKERENFGKGRGEEANMLEAGGEAQLNGLDQDDAIGVEEIMNYERSIEISLEIQKTHNDYE